MIKCCSVGRWPLQTDLFFHLGTFLFKSQNIFQSGILQLKNNLNTINIHFMVLDLASYLDKLLDHRQMLNLSMIKDANVCLFCVTHRADIWHGGTHLPQGDNRVHFDLVLPHIGSEAQQTGFQGLHSPITIFGNILWYKIAECPSWVRPGVRSN